MVKGIHKNRKKKQTELDNIKGPELSNTVKDRKVNNTCVILKENEDLHHIDNYEQDITAPVGFVANYEGNKKTGLFDLVIKLLSFKEILELATKNCGNSDFQKLMNNNKNRVMVLHDLQKRKENQLKGIRNDKEFGTVALLRKWFLMPDASSDDLSKLKSALAKFTNYVCFLSGYRTDFTTNNMKKEGKFKPCSDLLNLGLQQKELLQTIGSNSDLRKLDIDKLSYIGDLDIIDINTDLIQIKETN